jgi:hypothetical protein
MVVQQIGGALLPSDTSCGTTTEGDRAGVCLPSGAAMQTASSSHRRGPFIKRRVLRCSARTWVELEDCFRDIGYGVRKSTDCDQGHRLIALVVYFPHRIWIEGWLPVHEELVLMVAMRKLQPDNPAAVRHPRHRMGSRLPPVKVTNEAHTLGLRRAAEEVHEVQGAARCFTVGRCCRPCIEKPGVHSAVQVKAFVGLGPGRATPTRRSESSVCFGN